MQIGPFELAETVLESAVGPTYSAVDQRFGRKRWVTVATVGPERRSIALAAIRADIAKLERHAHESILRPLEAGVWDERLIVVHDPPSAKPLREFLDDGAKRGEPMVRLSAVLPADTIRVAGFIRNLGKVVGACHAQDVVHGFVSPECVFVRPPGNALLFGAGLSALLAPRRDDADAMRYLAPEVLRSGAAGAVKRTDVYGLGMVAYECFTLRRPFEDMDAEDLLDAKRTVGPTSMLDLKPNLSPHVVIAVEAAIKPHATLRRLNPDSFGTVLADVDMADKNPYTVRRSLMRPEATRSPSWPWLWFWWWDSVVEVFFIGIYALVRLFTKF